MQASGRTMFFMSWGQVGGKYKIVRLSVAGGR
jgi:hypothetical protein